jgi:hypothetical protein
MSRRTSLLVRAVGRDRRRSVVALLFVAATAGVAYAAAAVVAHAPGFVGVVAAGAIVAASHAAWNDGVATSVLAVFAPAWAWQYHHLTQAVVSGSPGFDAVGIPALVAVPVGSGAYVLGRVAATDGDAVGTELAVEVLVGSGPRVATRTVVLAAFGSVAGGALALVAGALSLGFGPVASTAPLLVVLAVWSSYRGSGLVPSWVLVGVPLASVGGATWVVTGAQGGLSGAVGGAVFPAAVVALVAGTLAFVVGEVARRVERARTSATSA